MRAGAFRPCHSSLFGSIIPLPIFTLGDGFPVLEIIGTLCSGIPVVAPVGTLGDGAAVDFSVVVVGGDVVSRV